jgi:thiol:disulfide interchange protein
MNISVASISPVDATFILSVLVLLAGVYLSSKALKAPADDKRSQQVFAAVGVLFGLLAAGGVGTLFAQQSTKTAENAATSAGETAANQVLEEPKVEKALESSESGSNGSGEGKSEGGGEGKKR